MSNSLIPYSFTPGTKARAQEVNANFTALSEKIEENRTFTTLQIADTLQKLDQATEKTDINKADINLANTKLVTNCILEAPNGVVEVTDNIITVKSGLKVLIPDGYDENGNLKSIIGELSEDTDVTTVSNSYLNCIYVTPTGCNCAQGYFACENEPNDKRGIWYVMSENKTYLYNAESAKWESIQASVITLYENKSDVVTLYDVQNPIKLMTYSDKMNIINWIIPSFENMVRRSWGTDYIAQKNGWVYVFGTSQTNSWIYLVVNGSTLYINWVLNGAQASSVASVPVKRGDSYRVSGMDFSHNRIYFIPMEGDM